MAKYFKKFIEENNLENGIYVEPYAGGASIALFLIIEKHASKVIINDIDKSIFAFWYSVLNHTDELCNLIEKTPVTVDMWRKQKEIQINKKTAGLLTLGFSTFFLNRTNRSGIINGAGVIGGVNQNGKWKINARFNKKDLIRRIRKIADYKNKIELYNLDALKLIRILKTKLPSETLFFLDPPYYNQGKELYLNYYNDEDHKKISVAISGLSKQKWVMTYDDAKLIRQLYKHNKKKRFSISYSAGKAKKGKELMIYSNNIDIMPRLPSR